MKFSNIQKGFTLIELVIVFAIIVILAGISLASFRNIQPNIKLNGAARNLVTDLRYAQQLAIAEQIDYGVFFSTSTHGYKILKHENTTTTIKVVSLPGGISYGSITPLTGYEMRFNSYGAVKEEGSISLINDQNTSTTVTVSPSGFVKISH